MENCPIGCCGEDTLKCGWKEDYDIPGAVCTPVRAGQLLFHPMWLPHRVPPTNDPDNMRIALAMDFEVDNAACVVPPSPRGDMPAEEATANTGSAAAPADVSQLRHQWHVAERLGLHMLSAAAAFVFHTTVPKECDRSCLAQALLRMEGALRMQFSRDVGRSGPRSTPAMEMATLAGEMGRGQLQAAAPAPLSPRYYAEEGNRHGGDFAVLRVSDGESNACRVVFADWRAKQ